MLRERKWSKLKRTKFKKLVTYEAHTSVTPKVDEIFISNPNATLTPTDIYNEV